MYKKHISNVRCITIMMCSIIYYAWTMSQESFDQKIELND